MKDKFNRIIRSSMAAFSDIAVLYLLWTPFKAEYFKI